MAEGRIVRYSRKDWKLTYGTDVQIGLKQHLQNENDAQMVREIRINHCCRCAPQQHTHKVGRLGSGHRFDNMIDFCFIIVLRRTHWLVATSSLAMFAS